PRREGALQREWWLLAVAALALAVRVAYVVFARRNYVPGGDAFYYHAGANLLVDGKGFVEPFLYPQYRLQSAEHPPLYLLYLAVPSLLGMRSPLTQMLWTCVAGTATVVVVGLAAREIGGRRLAVIAALLAALYPNLWAADGALMAESLAMFFV